MPRREFALGENESAKGELERVTRLEPTTFSLGSGESESEGCVAATTCDGGVRAGFQWDSIASRLGLSEDVLRRVVEVLGGIPEDERGAIVEHVERLARQPRDRRAALMVALSTLAGG